MTTLKVAISMPEKLVNEVDKARKKESMSRSGYITRLVRQAIRNERQEQLKAAYDRIFSDPDVSDEQKTNAVFFEKVGNDRGQEW